MATSLGQPGWLGGPLGKPPRGRRAAIAAIAGGVLLALVFGAGLVAALGGGPLSAGDEEADGGTAPDRLAPSWASLEPLLPLAPGLKEISALKRSGHGGPSRVLASRDDRTGALRLRALPGAGGRAGRPIAALRRAPARLGRLVAPARAAGLLPATRRVIHSRRLLRPRRALGDLRRTIDRDLAGVPGGGAVAGGAAAGRIPPIEKPVPVDVPRPGMVVPPVVRPPIDARPGLVPLPGLDRGAPPRPGTGGARLGGSRPGGGSGGPVGGGLAGRGPARGINVTVGDLRADSRFDVLLVSSGRRVVERYVFRDRDLAGLSILINLRSRLVTAAALRDGQALARVAAVPLGGRGEGARRPGSAGRRGLSALRGRSRAGAGPKARRGSKHRSGTRARARRRGATRGGHHSPRASRSPARRARARPSRARPSRRVRRAVPRAGGRPRGGSRLRGGGSPSPRGGDDDDDDDEDDDD